LKKGIKSALASSKWNFDSNQGERNRANGPETDSPTCKKKRVKAGRRKTVDNDHLATRKIRQKMCDQNYFDEEN